jgi:MoaA/NifB/PqqE/SkfB family radical SAM enzyme
MNAGPNRKETIPIRHAMNWIEQISDYANGHVKVLSITGGEPFYDLDLLKKIVSFADSCKLITNVVTNAFWAKTKEDAYNILKTFPMINVLAISTDIYHQEYISIEQIRNAVLAAKECGIYYNIHITVNNDSEYRKICSDLQDIVDSKKIISVSTFPSGRAKNTKKTPELKTSDEPPLSACTAGSSPVILPNGNVLACMGPLLDLKRKNPLILGNLKKKPLHEILDESEKNILLQLLRVWGPRKIITLLEESGMKELIPKKYVQGSVCDTCYKIMSNSKILSFFQDNYLNEAFLHYVAYARIFYLKETRMAHLCDLIKIDKDAEQGA